MNLCPYGCGVPLQTIDVHGSIVTVCCKQKVQSCCGD